MRTCAYCGGPAKGTYFVHRDAFGEGPEMPLCRTCARGKKVTLADIWRRIGQSDVCLDCQDDIRPGDERAGSFHAWCTDVRDRELPARTG